MASSEPQLYDETFTVTSVSAGKYERVARLTCASTQTADTKMTLDINTELYPCAVGETLQVVLASTLALDGSGKDESAKGEGPTGADAGWRDLGRDGQATLADLYDYVCRGKIYRFEEGQGAENLKVYVSFGGLLMYLDGPFKKLTGLRIDYVYLCMKK